PVFSIFLVVDRSTGDLAYSISDTPHRRHCSATWLVSTSKQALAARGHEAGVHIRNREAQVRAGRDHPHHEARGLLGLPCGGEPTQYRRPRAEGVDQQPHV
ncbi:hypothetical protein, partial [Amycolatopsis sp. lyj-23]|uniref:hypothetical protein n=1 Tax=Amycolatopsis sp. lyj-23 TaxID=2789283 RepID=UPI00397C5A11